MTQSSSETKSLLHWLHLQFPDSPKKRIKSWFQEGRVKYNGETAYTFHLEVPDPKGSLELVDKTQARGPSQTQVRVHQQVKIVYIDKEIVVVNKTAGVLSVPSKDRQSLSAYDYIFNFLKKNSIGTPELFPVHRLDEYTSGLLCFALSETARESLISQLKNHTLERNYIAYVEGMPKPKKGTWEHALKLSPSGYDQFVMKNHDAESTLARTHYETIKVFQHPNSTGIRTISKLRLKLETGLKHQIRIQAASEGHPLIGDRKYHPAFKEDSALKKSKQTIRQALHAVRLGMVHPSTGEYLKWEVPLPKDLTEFEQDLKKQENSIE